MTKKICVQSGHWNTTSGAPREQERTIAIGLRLVDLLRANGFIAYHCDALADKNPAVTGQDWDLFLALHCDMDYPGNEGGGFVDYPDPAVDYVNAESKRIKVAIEEVYFANSGIRNVPSRSNRNTKFYYMWSVLSAKTPCVLIEMGESIDPHDSVILNDTERMAKILLNCIKNAFPSVKPVDPCESYKTIIKNKDTVIADKDATIALLNRKISELQQQLSDIANRPIVPPTPIVDCGVYINQIEYVKSVIWGKGWWWTMIKKLRDKFPK